MDNDHDTIILEIYNDNKEIDSSELSYSLKYRTNKENNFKNYKTTENIKITEQKTGKENNKTKISILIPSIKDNSTSEVISAQYYLKIYNYSNKVIFVNGTISLVDNLEPYKIIEFNGKNENYTQNIELSNDNEKYFLLFNAIIDERELLSYNSVLVEIEKEEEPVTDMEIDSGSKGDNQSSGLPGWALALITILAVLLVLAIGFFIFRCVMKIKGNVVEEDDNQKLVAISDEV